MPATVQSAGDGLILIRNPERGGRFGRVGEKNHMLNRAWYLHAARDEKTKERNWFSDDKAKWRGVMLPTLQYKLCGTKAPAINPSDYFKAAISQAKEKGITDEKIKSVVPDYEPGGVSGEEGSLSGGADIPSTGELDRGGAEQTAGRNGEEVSFSAVGHRFRDVASGPQTLRATMRENCRCTSVQSGAKWGAPSPAGKREPFQLFVRQPLGKRPRQPRLTGPPYILRHRAARQ